MQTSPSVLLCTSIGPGKGYASGLVGKCLAEMQGVADVHIVQDGAGRFDRPDGFGYPVCELPEPSLPLTIWGRCARVREYQRRYFLRGDWTHLYWHDADVVPPAGIIPALLYLGVPVATGLYNVRGFAEPVLPIMVGDGETHSIDMAGKMYVSGFGQGCMLIERSVLDATPYRAPTSYVEDGYGEDYQWCIDSGHRTLLDTSLACWHVGADMNATRPRFDISQAIGETA